MDRFDFCRRVYKLKRLFGIQSIFIESEYLLKRYYLKWYGLKFNSIIYLHGAKTNLKTNREFIDAN